MGALRMGALVFGIYIRAPEVVKTPILAFFQEPKAQALLTAAASQRQPTVGH